MTEAPAKTKTEYVVLRSLPRVDATGTDQWEVFDSNIQASSAADAIKQSTTTPGSYVAIPASSWKPRKVSVENVQRVKLEDA